MKTILISMILTGSLACSFAQNKTVTFCNPMNLNYRFQPTGRLAYREAADPVVTIYDGKYILYASHSGGYWFSEDMLDWEFLPVKSLPIEDYAPDVITISDTTYYMASASIKKNIFYTLNPYGIIGNQWKRHCRFRYGTLISSEMTTERHICIGDVLIKNLLR
jgi:hypothetical protein